MNEDIRKIFNGELIIDNKIIPIEFEEYTGSSEEYIVYYDDGNVPYFYSNDKYNHKYFSISFHVYTKGNYKSIVAELNKKLDENNYEWDGDDGDNFENDTKYHHYICNYKKLI